MSPLVDTQRRVLDALRAEGCPCTADELVVSTGIGRSDIWRALGTLATDDLVATQQSAGRLVWRVS